VIDANPERIADVTSDYYEVVLNAIKTFDGFPSSTNAEDQRRKQNGADDESDSFADSYYSLRDEGRNPDGSGESYGERNS